MVQRLPFIALGDERVAVFVDGQNLFHALKKRGIFHLDYEKMARALAAPYGRLERRLLVTGVWVEAGGYIRQRRFTDALRYQGWEVVETRVEERPERWVEKESDTALAFHMTEDAIKDRWDILILVSGDGDLAYPVRKLRQMGKRVVVVQFEEFLSHHLKEAADKVVLLDDFLGGRLAEFTYEGAA
ncbi:LabA-like NYN domain-containing protein [Thermus filiformis]|uniref:NYN domain-containing protein n=1 Tax=Thermus filiformis TaxID=276 RepID=A0A0A2WNX6_THEFI|nr:NYN domain-containing protein [Thermus filiformis]KGQ21513.2 hypothetical protein THFILI_00950 [Thermus filiformis]